MPVKASSWQRARGIFEANGWPSEENPFLFNGDFVDRGPLVCNWALPSSRKLARSYSLEIMLILLAFKMALPQHFYLSRGNHEARDFARPFGIDRTRQ